MNARNLLLRAAAAVRTVVRVVVEVTWPAYFTFFPSPIRALTTFGILMGTPLLGVFGCAAVIRLCTVVGQGGGGRGLLRRGRARLGPRHCASVGLPFLDKGAIRCSDSLGDEVLDELCCLGTPAGKACGQRGLKVVQTSHRAEAADALCYTAAW